MSTVTLPEPTVTDPWPPPAASVPVHYGRIRALVRGRV